MTEKQKESFTRMECPYCETVQLTARRNCIACGRTFNRESVNELIERVEYNKL